MKLFLYANLGFLFALFLRVKIRGFVIRSHIIWIWKSIELIIIILTLKRIKYEY